AAPEAPHPAAPALDHAAQRISDRGAARLSLPAHARLRPPALQDQDAADAPASVLSLDSHAAPEPDEEFAPQAAAVADADAVGRGGRADLTGIRNQKSVIRNKKTIPFDH